MLEDDFNLDKGLGYAVVETRSADGVAVAVKLPTTVADAAYSEGLQSSLEVALQHHPENVLPLVDSASMLAADRICLPSAGEASKGNNSLKATIWHNPRCSKSRETLAILEEAGAEVTVVEYLKPPPSLDQLPGLYIKAGMTPRDGLRKGEEGAKSLNNADEETILMAMAADPILIERPLVETAKGVRLGRPPEKVREIL